MKKLLFALLGIVVLLLVVVWVGPSLVDWRPRIVSAVRDATGRELRIDGSLHISLLPRLSVAASGIHLANAPGSATPEMLSIDSFSLRAELLPLLRKRLVIDALEIAHPVAHLEIDKAGRGNWVFAPENKPAAQPAPDTSERGSAPLAAAQIRELKLDQGQVSYLNAATGQVIDARDVALTAAMTGAGSPLALQGRMTLNGEPVSTDLSIDSPEKLAQGQQAKVDLALDTKHLKATFGGTAQQQPVPGLNGMFDLDIPSVGQLAAWLNEPLAKDQPDPGELKIHADFGTEGSQSLLREATITGAGLNAKASGSIDRSGNAMKVTAVLNSDVLDVDRYLPPQLRGNAVPLPASSTPSPAPSSTPPKNPLAGLSDQPFDLGALRNLDADIKVSIAGIKAMGYEVGRTSFEAAAKGGVLSANLSQLALYGGEIAGNAKLDATGDALALGAAAKIDHVSLDRLARLAMPETAVTGPVSATLDAKAQGKSPRAFVEGLSGKLALDLGGATIKAAGAQALSQLKVNVDLPGGDQAPNLQANAIYNGQRVTATASLAPLAKLAAGESFPAKLAFDSNLVTAHYDGAVQQRPVPGLDGTFDVDVPSVGKLAAWVGKPLAANEPDPGPLKVHATFASDGPKLALKDAAITGKAIDATAQAAFDGSAKPATFDAKIDVKQADLNAYLPPEEKQAKQAPTPAAPQQPQSNGWSTEPFDLAPLGGANGKAELSLAAVRYRDLDIKQGAAKLTLANRELNFSIDKLALAQGSIDGLVTLDASSGTAQLNEHLAISGVEARPILKAFAGSDRLGGTIVFETTVKGSGKNERELISSLEGSGHFKVTNGAIYGIDLAQELRKAGTLGFGNSETEKTDFSELSGSYTIKAGVIENRDLSLLAPLLRLTGNGTVPMPPRSIDYNAEAKLVPTLQGQGGKDALAGLPIPIKIAGSWSNPSYQIDWASVFNTVAADPERLKSLPSDLSKAAKGFGVDVPIPGAPGGSSGSPGNILKSLPQFLQQSGKPPASGGAQGQ